MGGHKARQRIPVLANADGSLSVLTDDAEVAVDTVIAATEGGFRARRFRTAPRHAHLGRMEIRISELLRRAS